MAVSNECLAIGMPGSNGLTTGGKDVRLTNRTGHLLALGSPRVAAALQIANFGFKRSETTVIISAPCFGPL